MESLLRETKLEVTNKGYCETYWIDKDPEIEGIPTHQYCAEGYAICWQDLGAPLVVDGKVIGVASWWESDFCEWLVEPNVFEDVQNVEIRDFIRNMTGI